MVSCYCPGKKMLALSLRGCRGSPVIKTGSRAQRMLFCDGTHRVLTQHQHQLPMAAVLCWHPWHFYQDMTSLSLHYYSLSLHYYYFSKKGTVYLPLLSHACFLDNKFVIISLLILHLLPVPIRWFSFPDTAYIPGMLTSRTSDELTST